MKKHFCPGGHVGGPDIDLMSGEGKEATSTLTANMNLPPFILTRPFIRRGGFAGRERVSKQAGDLRPSLGHVETQSSSSDSFPRILI